MRIFRSILFRYRHWSTSQLRRAYRRRAARDAWLYGGDLKWPDSTNAHVPIRIDGDGAVNLGDLVMLGYRPAPRIGNGEILLQARAKESCIEIGSRTAISNNLSIVAMASVKIGEDCLIGDMVSIYDCDFHEIEPERRRSSSGKICPVVIGKNVWIGSRVLILKGVSIGPNSVVAAGSVVVESIPANVVAAGVPAKVIRGLQDPEH
jgi:maltose O-acetyltransferase